MTAKTNVTFKITGPCMSLLLRDCECSTSDQMGFLIGEKCSITTQSISDEEMEQEKIETTITINGTFPIGLPFMFCSPLGRIDDNTLKEVLGSCEKVVVGWYMFRRNSSHRPSLKDNLLHQELGRALQHISPQYFLFCLISNTESDRNATHSLKITFSGFNRRRFQPVSVLGTNLGEPEDSNYKRRTNVDDSFKHVQQVFNSVKNLPEEIKEAERDSVAVYRRRVDRWLYRLGWAAAEALLQSPRATSSKQALTTLHSEVSQHVAELEASVSKLQAEVNRRLREINSAGHTCTEVPQSCPRSQESLPSTSVPSRGHPTSN